MSEEEKLFRADQRKLVDPVAYKRMSPKDRYAKMKPYYAKFESAGPNFDALTERLEDRKAGRSPAYYRSKKLANDLVNDRNKKIRCYEPKSRAKSPEK